MKHAILITSLLAALATAAWAQQPKQFGSITYPAPGNLDLDEGTVEIWLASNFDTDNPKSPNGLIPFDLRLASEKGYHYYWGLVSGSLAWIGFVAPRQSYVWTGALRWKTNEWHYLALTWSGRTRSVFVDGHARQSKPNEGPLQGEGRGTSSADVVVEGLLHGNLTGAQLIVGLNNSFMTVDELRISSIARSADAIALTGKSATAPTKEEYTLLLDHCDGGPAEVISGLSGEKGGAVSGAYKLVDGRFGKALQLWTE